MNFRRTDGRSGSPETSGERAARVHAEVKTIATATLRLVPGQIEALQTNIETTTKNLERVDPFGHDPIHQYLRLATQALKEAGGWAMRAADLGRDSHPG